MTTKRRKQTRNLRLAGTRSPATHNYSVHITKSMKMAGRSFTRLDRAARRSTFSLIRFFEILGTK